MNDQPLAQEEGLQSNLYNEILLKFASLNKWNEAERYLQFAEEYSKSKPNLSVREIIIIAKYSVGGFTNKEIRKQFGVDFTFEQKKKCLRMCAKAAIAVMTPKELEKFGLEEIAGHTEIKERFKHFPKIKDWLKPDSPIFHLLQRNPHYRNLLELLSDGINPSTIAKKLTRSDFSNETMTVAIRNLSHDFLKSFARGQYAPKIGRKLARAMLFTDYLDKHKEYINGFIIDSALEVLRSESAIFDLKDVREGLKNIAIYDAILQNRPRDFRPPEADIYLTQLAVKGSIPVLFEELAKIIATQNSYQYTSKVLAEKSGYKKDTVVVHISGLVRFFENCLLYDPYATGSFLKKISQNRGEDMQKIAKFLRGKTAERLGMLADEES